MCEQVKKKCAKSAFESCRVNCGKYDPPPDGCGHVVRRALECARDASDLLCANVAPESCASNFRQISACASGKNDTAPEPTTGALPVGFTSYEDASHGIRAPMPEGVAAATAPVIAHAKHPEGATYSIRKLPRPEGKLTQKVFMKVAMNLLGRCSDKMKLQGLVDKPGRTSMNYVTRCPDGTEERGVFWATDKALFVASARGEPGRLGPVDEFVYGFEAR